MASRNGNRKRRPQQRASQRSQQGSARSSRQGTYERSAQQTSRTSRGSRAQTAQASQPINIKSYRKPLNLNIGMLIFGAILIYVVFCVIAYFRTGHIVRYEVQSGSLATNNIYRGMALRDEHVVNVTSAGYINYYANEGERVAAHDLVCFMDETGRLNEELENMNMGENMLSSRELSEFRSELANFSHSFDRKEYINVYDFKNALKSTVQKLANNNMLESIERIDAAAGLANVVERCYAPETGVVSYWIDGYEGLNAEQVVEEMFDKDAYDSKKEYLLSNALKEKGDVGYKLSTNEKWSIVIPVPDLQRGQELESKGYIRVRFLKNQYESWGATTLLHNEDGKHYLKLSFTNSMITFINDRFLEIELLIDDETGLKIPNSAIVDKEFYLIPEEFVTVEGESDKGYVLKQVVTEKGDVSSETFDISIYSYDEKEKEYYVDATFLNAADVLLKVEGQDTCVVSKRATLTGVYNVNNGYADFRQIHILSQNDEYSIVESNTRYGLNVYDYIALNADMVHEDQFINE